MMSGPFPSPTTTATSLLLSTAAAAAVAATTAAAGAVDLNWYPPAATEVNNLTSALRGPGTYGFIYNTSRTPDARYGSYNWCNMPHVRRTEYPRVRADDEGSSYELRYVEVLQRHHKRTPYAANAFPVEPYRWDCDDQGLYYFGQSLPPPPPQTGTGTGGGGGGKKASAQTYWKGTQSSINPFVPAGWIGSCQFPQITTGGLDDSRAHGEDLYDVYHALLGFLPGRDEDGGRAWRRQVVYRVTNNQITSQVAGQLIAGMWGVGMGDSVPLLVQARGVDSLEPQYPCPAGTAAFDRLRSRAHDARWRSHLDAARGLYATLDAISGVPAPDDDDDDNDDALGFHASFDHYYDNLSARQCHEGKPLPCNATTGRCVDQESADAVYRLGQWEYSHLYRDAGPLALRASVAAYGVWIAELASHLRAVVAAAAQGGGPAVRYFHNIAHDGSVSRVLAILQIDTMVWPGMGSEVIFEVYRKKTATTASDDDDDNSMGQSAAHYVRVLFGGQPLKSSNPSLGLMDMLPMETLLAYFDGLVGQNASLIMGKCDGSIPL